MALLHPLDRQLAEGFLFTDLYELTMAQLYFRVGIHETPAQFDHFFRSYPDYGSHRAGYCINAGLEWLLQWILETRAREEDMEGLREIRGRSGERLFADDFLAWLREHGRFDRLTLQAIPEGRVVHPNEPITVVQGPLAVAQILESALLNRLNYQTLVATKAARMKEVGRGGLLVDFGMRRAQDLGANAAARAALIGGADFTSNTGMSLALGYPPKGTHAHSMVQAFMALGAGEREAFRQYAELYPDDCILLVDTIDTLASGIPHAIEVFEDLKRKGHRPVGVRLDSGDLAYLAVQAARMLDQAGFPDCSIVVSNQLDERVILQLISQVRDEARRAGMDAEPILGRLAYGVGTHLVTSVGDPALDGVYKLTAIQQGGCWRPALKVSENPDKVPNPGNKSVWRLYDEAGLATADYLCPDDEDPRDQDVLTLRHPVDASLRRRVPTASLSGLEPLLATVLENGELQADLPDLEAIRRRRDQDLAALHLGVKRIIHPHTYHVSLSPSLWDLKQDLVEEARAVRS